jgi:hypothetical protein
MSRRIVWIVSGAVLALVTASLAVASHRGAQTDAAAATFSATEVKRIKSRTCEGSDGTYKITHAVLEGAVVSASDPVLAGQLRLHLKSVYNTTEGLGWVAGKAQIRNESADPDTRARATFRAVNVGGELEGMFVGGAGAPHWKVLANFSATLGDSGVTAGQIGGGSSVNSALLFRGGCGKAHGDAATALQGEREKGKGHGRKNRP